LENDTVKLLLLLLTFFVNELALADEEQQQSGDLKLLTNEGKQN
jgi:hypothetical protein